jgi:phospholipase/lecithinase/hemolysin
MNTYIAGVTNEIVKNVERLQRLGVRKVLVNNLHPIGCTPLQSSSSNYTTCDLLGNYGASLHNSNLEKQIVRKNNAHIIDLYTAFTDIVNHASRKCMIIGYS